jgi:hypothetical protein
MKKLLFILAVLILLPVSCRQQKKDVEIVRVPNITIIDIHGGGR